MAFLACRKRGFSGSDLHTYNLGVHCISPLGGVSQFLWHVHIQEGGCILILSFGDNGSYDLGCRSLYVLRMTLS